MNKPNVAKIIGEVKLAVRKHSPEILTGIGIAGMITTTVLAVKATPKALKLIEEKKKEERLDKLPPIDVVKATWKCYIPAVVTGAVSVGCLVGASSVNARRNAALATAYKLSETALTEYKEKVVETLGAKKEEAIREKIDKDHIEQNPPSKNEIIITKKGETLCYDSLSGRYFKSDIDRIKNAAAELNHQMASDTFGYVSLNEFYDELNIGRTPVGDDLGWNITKGLIKLYFTTQLSEDETPCIVINYEVAPKYGYSKVW